MAEAVSWKPAEVDLDLGTDPIPAGPYYREDYFEAEREAVFRRSWLQVGHVCELPERGAFVVLEIEVLRASVIVTRDAKDRIRAFHNVCTHRGTRLVDTPRGRSDAFVCPYHGWAFGTDGRLRGAPDFDRFYVDKADCGLREVAIEGCAGLLFVYFGGEPEQSLREYLGAFAPELEKLPVARATHFSEYVYEIRANWKLSYDNFQENYHLRFIHPRTGEAAVGPDNRFGYPVDVGFEGPHRTQQIWANPSPSVPPTMGLGLGLLAMQAVERGDPPNPHDHRYFALFPNFFLYGSSMQHFSHTIWPLEAGRSRGVIRLYWVGADDKASVRFGREYAMVTAREIHTEDRGVIEAGQRGLESGALEHIHFQSQEVLCRHFFTEVDRRVRAWREAKGEGGSAR